MESSIIDFDDMGLKETILQGIYAFGFENPSPIQQKAILPGASGKDLKIHAQSGTGKTGAFCIGALNRIENTSNTEILIISPTRDLAIQTGKVIRNLSAYMDVRVHESIGGTSARDDGDALRTKPNIISGTPGRINDQIKRSNLDTSLIKVLIIDEVDEMLSQGFVDDMKSIVQSLIKGTQIIVASATYRAETHTICDELLQNPVKIEIKQEDITLEGIKQFYIDVGKSDFKTEVIFDLYDQLMINKSVIFVNTRRSADKLGYLLKDKDFSVSTIHGELTQLERNEILKDFTNGKTRILIASDILARGIDIQQVSIVINFDLPTNKENYIHRIGRSGRFGRKGVSINLIASENKYKNEMEEMKEIEQFYSTTVEEMPSNFTNFL
jgi:translation initiation factor 4A